jgi:hypothetical protein
VQATLLRVLGDGAESWDDAIAPQAARNLLGLDVAEAAVVMNASVQHVRRLSSAGSERLIRQIAAKQR